LKKGKQFFTIALETKMVLAINRHYFQIVIVPFQIKKKEVVIMIAWLKALRLPICFLYGLLVITGFRLGGIKISWIVVSAVFFTACSIMLQNDWRDRYHDSRKNKMLVLQHSQSFLIFLITFWLITCGLIFVAASRSVGIGMALSAIALAGFIYSETRKIPMAPVMLVALTSGSPVLLSIVTGADGNKIWLLFLSITLIIFGREITKDLDDEWMDGGYKWTIPLKIGRKRAKAIAISTILAGLVVATQISPMVLPSMVFAIFGVMMLIYDFQPRISRFYLDVGVAFVLITIIFLD
jgi:4-hydroxybenzoate polyprenyltransferase